MTYTRDENLQFFEDGSSKIGVVRFLVPQNVSFLRSLATKMTLSFKICQKRGLFDLKLSKDDAGSWLYICFLLKLTHPTSGRHVSRDGNRVTIWRF